MARTRARAVALVSSVLALGACSSVSIDAPDVDFEVIEEVAFAPALGIDLAQMTKLSSGVYIQDLVEGEGAALATTDSASVRYSGWLRTGVMFDTGQFDYRLGQNQVIPGFEQGILGMKAGGSRLIIIPPELGYGASAFGPIRPGSILVFEVELLAIPSLVAARTAQSLGSVTPTCFMYLPLRSA